MKTYYTAANDFTIFVDHREGLDNDGFDGIDVSVTDMHNIFHILSTMNWEDDGETKYIDDAVETLRQLASTFTTVANDLEKLKEKE